MKQALTRLLKPSWAISSVRPRAAARLFPRSELLGVGYDPLDLADAPVYGVNGLREFLAKRRALLRLSERLLNRPGEPLKHYRLCNNEPLESFRLRGLCCLVLPIAAK